MGYNILLEKLNISDDDLPQFDDFDEMKIKLAKIFSQKTRDEWCEIFDGTDACVTPVLEQEEAVDHPQNKARRSFLDMECPDQHHCSVEHQQLPHLPQTILILVLTLQRYWLMLGLLIKTS